MELICLNKILFYFQINWKKNISYFLISFIVQNLIFCVELFCLNKFLFYFHINWKNKSYIFISFILPNLISCVELSWSNIKFYFISKLIEK